MKSLKYLTVMGLTLLLCVSVNGIGLTAEEIIQRVDAHNFIANNFEMTIRVETYNKNRTQAPTVMKGYVNDGEMTSLLFLEPANMKDRKIIIKGNDMWIIIPKVKNPIHVTPSQKLMGGISYGDVVKVKYASSFQAKINGEEEITGLNPDGTNSAPQNCYRLELTAKEARQSYHQIMMWVEQQDFLPVKADFYALSGKKMMTVFYTGAKPLNGKTIVTKLFLLDQINVAKHVSVEYSDIIINNGSQN